MSKTGTERFNEAKTVKMQDVIKRRQILTKMAENIPTNALHLYILIKRKTTVLVTKRHIFRRRLIFSCPECEEGVVTPYSFFCPNCGIKLKWAKGTPHGD